MPISRGQMERQLRMGGGIMNIAPRQGALLGGLKKAVKGVVGGVKSAAKGIVSTIKDNPALALAALNFAPMLAGKAPFIGMGSLAGSKYTIPGLSALAGEKTLGTTAKVFAGGSLLGAVLGGLDEEEEQDIVQGRNLTALEAKLRTAYNDLGTFKNDPEGLEAQIKSDLSEYNKDTQRGIMAVGGRVGLANGFDEEEYLRKIKEEDKKSEEDEDYIRKIIDPEDMASVDDPFYRSEYLDDNAFEMFGKPYKELNEDELEEFREEMMRLMNKFSQKPTRKRITLAAGSMERNVDQASGIMGLPQRTNAAGVKELDLRKSGGFIPPVGVKEKADDIPAMLSNNEFVFTADAVRGMGDGNVNKGAQRMYDMMKSLENKVV